MNIDSLDIPWVVDVLKGDDQLTSKLNDPIGSNPQLSKLESPSSRQLPNA
jgi:hypothetical protein